MERRQFFRWVTSETVGIYEELTGRPRLQLKDLDSLPDEVIGQLVPQIIPGTEILVTEEQICARRGEKEEPIVLFAREPVNTLTFNLFNGLRSVSQVADEVAASMEWEEKTAFAFTREFFVKLVNLRVCLPSNPVPEETTSEDPLSREDKDHGRS